MKVIFAKILALGGLCALFAGVSSVAMAQDNYHGEGHRVASRAHQRLQRLHAVYYHEINSGNRAAARRAHLRAKAIRARLRAHRRAQHLGY